MWNKNKAAYPDAVLLLYFKEKLLEAGRKQFCVQLAFRVL